MEQLPYPQDVTTPVPTQSVGTTAYPKAYERLSDGQLHDLAAFSIHEIVRSAARAEMDRRCEVDRRRAMHAEHCHFERRLKVAAGRL